MRRILSVPAPRTGKTPPSTERPGKILEPVGCRRQLPRVREGCSPCPPGPLFCGSRTGRPAPGTPTGRPFRDGPSPLSADRYQQTQKAPDARASGAYVRWSCVNKNHTFYTINSKCYIFVKIWIPTKIPTLYFHAMEQMPPVPLLPLHPGLALASPSSVSPPPERPSFPAGDAFTRAAACLAWEKRNSVVRIPFGPGAPCGAAPQGKGIPAHGRGRPTPARRASSRS